MNIEATGKRRRRKCPIPKSTFTTYMDEGIMHYRAGHYRKALFCFDRAIELQPAHKGALVARSQCHLKLGDAASALKDAEASFERNHPYIQGLFQYAESLFALGQFEKALIAYERGFRHRRDIDDFRIGAQKCREAILTAIGDRQATQIEDFEEILPLIEEMEELKRANYEHCCIRFDTRTKKKPSKLKQPSKARQHWIAHEVLGSMFFDKKYLTKFLNRPDIKSDQGLSHALRGHANEALNYLKIREKFWREQNPMYSRKVGLNFNNNMVLRYEEIERLRQEASRKIKMDAALGAVEKNMSLIEHSLSIGRPSDAKLECQRTMRQIKEMSTRLLPRKAEFMCRILYYKGVSLTKMKKYDAAVNTFQQELNIAIDNKLRDFKGQALMALGRALALKKCFSEAAEAWEQRISMAKLPLERALLSHEIGRCYYEMRKFDVAKFFAKQCLDEAAKINDGIWQMNGYIFLAQIAIKQMDLHEALGVCETGESYVNKVGHQTNAKLLRDGAHCLRVWIEKRDQEELETKHSMASFTREDSDDDITESPNRETTPEQAVVT